MTIPPKRHQEADETERIGGHLKPNQTERVKGDESQT